MKTKEFMAKVRSLEFEIEMEDCWVVIRAISGAKQLKINKNYASVVFFRGNYNSEIDRNLLNLVVGYLNTPKEEREEEKRYWLRIVANLGFMDDQRFLNLNIEREEYFICSARQSEWVKTIFTESEISQMDITGFEKVEVNE